MEQQMLRGVELHGSVATALRTAGAQVSGRPIDTRDLLVALMRVDAGEWGRLWLHCGDPDQIAGKIVLDPATGSSASWEGVPLTDSCATALDIGVRLAHRYHMWPLPAGLLALALVADESTAAAQALGENLDRAELLQLLQSDILGVSLSGIDTVLPAVVAESNRSRQDSASRPSSSVSQWFRKHALLGSLVPIGIVAVVVTVAIAVWRDESENPQHVGSAAGVQWADCLKRDADSFRPVSCTAADAAYVVLDRAGDGQPHKDCIDVAGTEYAYYEGGSYVCVAAKGTDVEHAVNTAQEGDCLTGGEGSDVQRVDCTDSSAAYRVLARRGAGTIATDMACGGVKGTERTYTYILKSVDGVARGLGTGVAFCLAAKGTDTSRTADNAQVGSCLKRAGGNDVQVVDCGAPDAAYKVLRTGPTSAFCTSLSGVIATYSYKRPGDIFTTYLCLGSAH